MDRTIKRVPPRYRRRRLSLAAFVAALPVAWAVWQVAAPEPERSRSALDGAGLPVGRDGSVTFAAGACRAYRPSVRPKRRTVFVDAGHGGLDSGATSTAPGAPIGEEDLTLAIARRTRVALQAAGFRVIVSRQTDQNVVRLGPRDVAGESLTATGLRRDIEARNVCANAGRAEALVAVHVNSFTDPGVGGAQTLYNAGRPFSSRSRQLAQMLQRSLVASMTAAAWPTVDRGISTDRGTGADALTREAAAYGQLLQLGPASPPWFRSPTVMPGAVVEPLFITSATDAARARTDDGQQAIASGLTRGLELYFEAVRAP